MQLSSNSERYFKREFPDSIGWRFHFDCSSFTHVRVAQLNMEPFYSRQLMCRIYCNLVSKTITDPFGTLTVIGGTTISPAESGIFSIVPDYQ